VINLLISESLSDVLSFILCKDDTIKLGVEGDVLKGISEALI